MERLMILLAVVAVSVSSPFEEPGERPMVSKKCPEDIEAAVMGCSANIMSGPLGDQEAYCKIFEEYFTCLGDVVDRCQNDTRFSALPAPPNIDQLRQQAHLMCNPSLAENIIRE